MLRQQLALCVALCAVACAQIAGFKELSPRQDEPADGGSGGAGANRGGASMRAGSGGLDSGGNDADETAAGESNGGAAVSGGGNAGTSGNVAGSVSTGGTPTAGTSSTTAGTNATAGSGGSIGDEVVGGCNAEQLKNGFFDRGAAAPGWQLDPNSTALGITEPSDVILEKQSSRLLKVGVAPESGNYLAWLGSAAAEEPAHITFFQLVTVPDKVTRLVLSGYIRIRTEETDLSSSSDQIDLALDSQDPLDERFWSFKYWAVKEDGAPDTWQKFEYAITERDTLSTLRGHTWRFKAESIADVEGTTTFWLDSLSLIAECP